MKTLLTLSLLMLACSSGWAQPDSTTVSLAQASFSDDNLALISKLNHIQIMDLIFADTSLRGQVLRLHLSEYRAGELVQSDSFGITCGEQTFYMYTNNFEGREGLDTLVYELDYCDQLRFPAKDTMCRIKLGGKWQGDSLRLIIDYPRMKIPTTLSGASNYKLWRIHAGSDMRVPLGEAFPIVAYTPPVSGTQGFGYYCLLGAEQVADWHRVFGIEHFYVFWLTVEARQGR